MTSSVPPRPVLDDELVDRLLESTEGPRFETKRVGNNQKKLETILAFANTEGGLLALGVEDAAKATGRARVIGIGENAESIDELRRLVRMRLTPPLAPPDAPAPQFREVACTLRDGSVGSIMLVKVPKSPGIHSIVDDGTFVPLDRSNRQLSAAEITELTLRRGVVSYVAQPVDVDMSLLETPEWSAYARARRVTRPLPEALRHLGLAKVDASGAVRPTRAAVLLFAEEPSGLLDEKCSVRLFHYRGVSVERGANTNLLRPPRTIGGPLIELISRAEKEVVGALASGVTVGPLGFEIAQRYPIRVLREAVTNAVLHRDYREKADIHVRIFDDRIEVESPGGFPANVTASNIAHVGSHPRNRALVDHLREFPSPPNLDAGEGVPMMREVMAAATLYPPLFDGPDVLGREAVQVTLRNDARPSIWDQVEAQLDRHGTIGNAEVRALMRTDDPVRASKQLKEWVTSGLLVVANPTSSRAHRRYRKPHAGEDDLLFLSPEENDPAQTGNR